MATRRQIRESFYAELDTAAGTLVPSDNISQEDPNSKEDLPAITHDDAYRPVPMNNKTAPTRATRNNAGVIQSVTFTTPMQARFTLTIQSENEQEKENIYESVREHFEDYTYSASHFPDPSDIQTDMHELDVQDSDSQDFTDRDPPSRGDVLLVTVGYERTKVGKHESVADGSEDFTFENIEEVQHDIDADNDRTTDETYTTT